MKNKSELIELLFVEASGIANPEERAQHLEKSCSGDEDLRNEVESLLLALDEAGTFMEKPTETIAHHPLRLSENPRMFGDYELLEEVARGGMGVVYKARQIRLNRIVAVKMILTGQLASESEVKRFHSEAEAAGSLSHPNIVSIYEVGEQDGYHYYSMPLVEGMSLAHWVKSGQWEPDDGKEAARVILKLAQAVQYAHEQGILHRDLKPGNILLDGSGEPHILDFGLAKRMSMDSSLTMSGDLLGTPSFMAPEHAEGKGKESTTSADIYNLGAILYFLLTGRPPFVADSALDAILLVIEGDAVLPRSINPRVPIDLERICIHCLEKSPEKRYASAKALGEDIERCLRNEPLAYQPAGINHKLRGWFKRQPALASRVVGLTTCAVISEAAYRLGHSAMHPLAQYHQIPLSIQHYRIMLVLGLWALASGLCQWALEKGKRPEVVRFIWAGLDAALLTAILLIDQAVQSSLVGVYFVWVVGSGLWQRVSLVLFTTGMALLGYTILIFDALYHRAEWIYMFHWHGVVMAMLLLAGLITSYLVHRVSVLSRFYDRRPKT